MQILNTSTALERAGSAGAVGIRFVSRRGAIVYSVYTILYFPYPAYVTNTTNATNNWAAPAPVLPEACQDGHGACLAFQPGASPA